MKKLSFLKDRLNISEDEFYKDVYGKKYFHFKLGQENWSDLCSLAKVDEILNLNELTTKDLNLFQNGVPVSEYSFRFGKADHILKDRVFQYIKEKKCSMKISNIGTFDKGLAALSQELAIYFKRQINMNIYFTPAGGGSCFLPHQDAYDIFILQLEGQKKWKVAQGTQHYYLNQDEKNQAVKDCEAITISKGDALYLPAKIAHQAFCEEDNKHSSLHLTVGIHELSYKDFLEFLMSDSKAQLLFQKGISFDGAEFNAEEVRQIFNVFFNGFLNKEMLPKLLADFYQEEVVHKNRNISPFKLQETFGHNE